MDFGNEFKWGVATSSYQIEGAANEDGRGDSVWDTFCRVPGNIFSGQSGEIACDHYHRWKDDIHLMHELGVNAYRFSISWPRILPYGTGAVNQNGIKFYSNLVDELLRCGIEPCITLFHWDLPQALQDRGGWLNPDSPLWFESYAKIIAETFSDRVKTFMTFNEPPCFVSLGYESGIHAPGLKLSRRDILLIIHHVLLAHGRAVKAIRTIVPDAQIGFALNFVPEIPVSNSSADIEAAKKSYFSVHTNFSETGDPDAGTPVVWTDPIFKGQYPAGLINVSGKDMPEYTPEEMNIISRKIDFLGLNIYSGRYLKDSDGLPVQVPFAQGAARTAINWKVTQEALYWGCKFQYERYHTPIVITENGLSCMDWVSLDGKVHDPQRIDFLHRYLIGLKQAVNEGIKITGYMHWSFMDNFEWANGYNDRFGLVYVDYKTQKRIPKDSFYWYKNVISTNGSCI